MKINYWDRETSKRKVEPVYGDLGVRLCYGNPLGRLFTDRILATPFWSQWIGSFQNSPKSRKRIQPFVKKYKIPLEEFEPQDYANFNEFFIRKFQEGARPFAKDEREFPAFAEGRYLAFESLTSDLRFPIKGVRLDLSALLKKPELEKTFQEGPLLIARLCPTDYHRFHYPDSGKTLDYYRVSGKFHSVNPLALRSKGDILFSNERRVSILETHHFKKLAYVEIGALCVGKIAQTHPPDLPFKRAEEKGYFLFGASTIAVIGEKGAWKIDPDLLQKTKEGLETLVKLGQRIAFG